MSDKTLFDALGRVLPIGLADAKHDILLEFTLSVHSHGDQTGLKTNISGSLNFFPGQFSEKNQNLHSRQDRERHRTR